MRVYIWHELIFTKFYGTLAMTYIFRNYYVAMFLIKISSTFRIIIEKTKKINNNIQVNIKYLLLSTLQQYIEIYFDLSFSSAQNRFSHTQRFIIELNCHSLDTVLSFIINIQLQKRELSGFFFLHVWFCIMDSRVLCPTAAANETPRRPTKQSNVCKSILRRYYRLKRFEQHVTKYSVI